MLVEIKKINKEECPVVSSLDVAETFGKRHDHVVRDIRELLAVEDFNILNSEEVNTPKIGDINAPKVGQSSLAAVRYMEALVSGLVGCGWEYDRIKEFIEQANTRRALTA